MTGDAFWDLLRRAAERPTERERTEYVVAELQRLPRRSTAAFHRALAAARARADTPGLRAAARVVLGGPLVDDAYAGFHLWLLSLGGAAFERAVRDPDSLADVPRVQALAGGWAVDDHPAWPSLAEAVADALEAGCEPDRDTGADAVHDAPAPPLPRLDALFTDVCAARNETDPEVVTVVW